MPKKRRTRAQKIIAQLRRELANESKNSVTILPPKKEFKLSDFKPDATLEKEKKVINLYTYDQALVKKDLFKTLYLSIIFFALIGIFYALTVFFRL